MNELTINIKKQHGGRNRYGINLNLKQQNKRKNVFKLKKNRGSH
jgi:hypothetical protein